MARQKSKPEHYVNNKEFLLSMLNTRRVADVQKKIKTKETTATDYIGSCFLKIANHLSYKQTLLTTHTETI